jgi:sugar/nucleoside kinase (ribokinase family)
VSARPTYTWRARREKEGGDAQTLERFQGAYEGYHPQIHLSRPAGAVFLGSIDPRVQLAALGALPPGGIVAVDTMDIFIKQQRADVQRVITGARLLLITETELELLTRLRGIAASAALLLDMHRLAAVVVKRGAAGAVLATRAGAQRLPAYPTQVADPTGAGDVLAGAFLGRLVEMGGLAAGSLREPLEWGMVAASFAIETAGTAGIAQVGRAQVEERLAEYRALMARWDLETNPGKAGET